MIRLLRLFPCLLLSLLLGLLLAWTGQIHAATLVAGTDPDSGALFSVKNNPPDRNGPNFFSYEQLFTLSSAAEVTSLSINAASFSPQTLRMQLFSGLGLEGTGTLLQTFDIDVPGGHDGIPLHIPAITTARSFSLGAGDYSLLISLPNLSLTGDFIYQNAADSSNTPHGSLGGTHWSTGIISPGNIVFELDGTPVATPEPASILLLAMCFIGVGATQMWNKARRQA